MLLPNVRRHHRRRWLLYNFEHLAANQSFASSQQHGNQTPASLTLSQLQPWSLYGETWANPFSELVTSWTSTNLLLLGIVKQNGTWNHPKLLLNTKNWRQCVGNLQPNCFSSNSSASCQQPATLAAHRAALQVVMLGVRPARIISLAVEMAETQGAGVCLWVGFNTMSCDHPKGVHVLPQMIRCVVHPDVFWILPE